MSENNLNECGEPSDGESTEEEIEPKLKYVRMSNSLKEVLTNEIASCIAVHPKFICLGTTWGVVYLFDHQGNQIKGAQLKHHTVVVNMISIDSKGDCVASCSSDGFVHVSGLYGEPDLAFSVHASRHVRCVALENSPQENSRNKARIITGDDRLTLHERVYSMLGLARVKSTVLCESEGYVGAVAWQGQFVAWSSDTVGVRVYDIKARRSLGLIRWEKPAVGSEDDGGRTNQNNVPTLEDFRCNLRWADERTLLIGWADTVRVCIIRRRGSTPGLTSSIPGGGDPDELPEHQVDPISTFRTDFYISGIAPLDQQLVLLGVPRGGAPGSRPQLHVVEYRDCEYAEVCTDSLTLRGYEKYSCTDYHLDVLTDENRFFVVAPKDVVVASPCDLDDRVHWLVQHGKYEQAMDAVEAGNTQNHSNDNDAAGVGRKHTVLSVGSVYLDHLLVINDFERAGRLCLRLFGRDPDLWHSHVYKFARARRLRAISAYLPRTLGPHIYEMVLYEYLKTDSAGFLELVREWRQPNLYNIAAVVNAVLEHLLICDNDTDQPTLMEALAILYGHEGRYDKALSMYLKLGHTAVFDMIRENELYSSIRSMIVDLMQLDENKTVELLLHEGNKVPPDAVVETLTGSHDRHLYRYLDALDKADPRECGPYHGLMVRLYSIFCKEKLLPFLKRSDQYPIQEALDVCQRAKFYPEIVYLLGRMGDIREALALITGQLGDVRYALAFCQEHNDADLWADLVQHSATRPDFVTYLLPRVAGHLDPRKLVNRIESGVAVQGLKDALIRMLRQYNLQASIQEGCQKILVNDYFALHDRLVRSRQRGLHIGDDLLCGACHRHLLSTTELSRMSDLITYNCRHTFHEQCLSRPLRGTCAICSSEGGISGES